MKFSYMYLLALVATEVTVYTMDHRSTHRHTTAVRRNLPPSHQAGGQAQEDRDLANAIRASLTTGPAAAAAAQADQLLPLPGRLQRLDKATIRHIIATQQGANQCGSRSVANALAIQDLVLAGESLTSANIRARASLYDHILIGHVIEWSEAAILAHENKLFNAHILGQTPKEQKNATNPYILFSTETQAHSLDDLTAMILTETTLVSHIICNTGGHWVLVSIIKQEGKKTEILYMDSGNAPLNDNSVATAYIEYLYNNCIA